MKLYNTPSGQIEEVIPREDGKLGFYACGITAYDYAHIGNLRRYVMDDVLIRALRYAGYRVRFVQNVTDVGHLTSDADEGEDKVEKGAKKYGKSAWEIAAEFENYFYEACKQVGNLVPDVIARATDHIDRQIAIAKDLEEKGYAYVIPEEGLYFDTSKFPTYGDFAHLKLEDQKEGSRVAKITGKRNPSDFALWKFEKKGEHRAMSWPSPWSARGFPGWHLECVAISTQFLGPQFDIHTGGIDHIPVHHTNEIAEAESYTGLHPFAKYWVHHNHMRVDDQKMSKSLGNIYRVEDVIQKGYSPMALRYLFLTTHYRSELNFTWEALAATQKAYDKIVSSLSALRQTNQVNSMIETTHLSKIDMYRRKFLNYVYNDLAIPQALTVITEVFKSNLFNEDKYDLIIEFDEILGLRLRQAEALYTRHQEEKVNKATYDAQAQELLAERQTAKKKRDFATADTLRQKLYELGYNVIDVPNGDAKLVSLS